MKKQLQMIGFGLTVMLLGAGCWKKTTSPSSSQHTSSTVIQTPSSTIQAEPTQQQLHQELKAISARFSKVKSFRSKVSVDNPQGDIEASLEFIKPNRFRGTVKTGQNAEAAEIIVISENVYMRLVGQQWINLTKTTNGKTIGHTLQNALNGDSNIQTLGTDATIPLKRQRDAAQECDVYTTGIRSLEGKITDISLCAADGLPKYLEVAAAQGPIHMDYYDYNALFLIEKPL